VAARSWVTLEQENMLVVPVSFSPLFPGTETVRNPGLVRFATFSRFSIDIERGSSTINGVYKNKEHALHYFGERLGVTLPFEGSEVVPDYYFADTQLVNAPGYPKFDTHVYVRR
jgi:hypothetical protein